MWKMYKNPSVNEKSKRKYKIELMMMSMITDIKTNILYTKYFSTEK